MPANDWKSDEVGYCEGLVRYSGDGNVPRAAVQSYLEVQITSARMDARPDAVAELEGLLRAWRAKLARE